MQLPQQALGPVSAQWNDYVGTAAADEALAVHNTPSLYELADLDRDRWAIVAVDIDVELGEKASVSLYAVDRLVHNIRYSDDIVDLAQDLGELPVTRFTLPDPSVEDFIKRAFKRISVRLVARQAREQLLVASTESGRSESDR